MKRVGFKNRGKPLDRKTPLRNRKRWSQPHRKGRDWDTMNEAAWTNAGGRCEICRKRLPLGTDAAHIIPRDINDLTLDEPWNLALLAWTGFQYCTCHTKLDRNRGKMYQEMIRMDPEPPLLTRILENPRLKEYFDIRLVRWRIREQSLRRDLQDGNTRR